MAKSKVRNHRYIPEKHIGLEENNKCPYCGYLVKITRYTIEPIGLLIVEHWNKKEDCYNDAFNWPTMSKNIDD